MDTLVVLLQVALAAVMAVAGIGKLMDIPGSRQAMRDFGVPARYASSLGIALPVAELTVAVLLIPGATARWAALAAGLLLLAFIGAIGWNLREGRHPDCHCFGQIHSEPAGRSTIGRNAVLTVAALAIVWHGGIGPIEWIESLSDVGLIAVAVTLAVLAAGAVQSWLLWRLIEQNRQLMSRLEALATAAPVPVATPVETSRRAPDFDLPAMDGSRMSLQGLLADRNPVLLLFADPGCGPCRSLVPDIAEWQRRFAGDLVVAVMSRGTHEENEQKFLTHGVGNIGLQDAWEVYEAYGVQGTPSGVLIQPDGSIEDAFAPGRDRIRELVARTVSGYDAPVDESLDPGIDDPESIARYLRRAKAPDVGTPGSRLPLPAIDGGFASLDDFLDQDAVVVFWNAGCGFCERMLPDLKEWEQEAGDLTDRVLIVSMGSVEDNQALGLRSKVVIDEGFTTGKAFGATGTPSAILLDSEGRVASTLAVGSDAVLGLLYNQVEVIEEPLAR